MRKIIFTIIFVFCLFSVSFAQWGKPKDTNEETMKKINRLSYKVSTTDVRTYLGQPQAIQTYINNQGMVLNAYYYQTNDSQECLESDPKMKQQCFTPLIFINKEYVGKGYVFLEEKVKLYNLMKSGNR